MQRIGVCSQRALAALILASLAAASSCAPEERHEMRAGDAAFLLAPGEESRRAPARREWFLGELDTEGVQSPGDEFGAAVGVSGSTAVVAARAGATAYVFVRLDDGWHQRAKLEPPWDFGDRIFGTAIAMSVDLVVVGAMPSSDPARGIPPTVVGAAYVYVRSGESWSEPVPLFADDGDPAHEFGRSVAVAGNTVVVGAPSATGEAAGEGAAYVFTRSGATWTQTSKVYAATSSSPGRFGDSMAISGTTLLVGAPASRGWGGQAYVLTPSGTGWASQLLSVPAFNYENLGNSVALDGNVAVVGARAHMGQFGGSQRGTAYVFAKSTSEWTQTLQLFADHSVDGDAFGTSVAVSGSTIMVGAPGDASGVVPFENAARTVFVFDAFEGSAIRDRIGMPGGPRYFGSSIALDGDIAVVGTAPRKDGAYVAEFLAPDGSPCDANLDCRARHCVAGICCDAACPGECDTCVSGTCLRLDHEPGPSCSPYLCRAASADCPQDCSEHADCVDTHYCRDGDCLEREGEGRPCTAARACVSGRCIDGECAGRLGIGARCTSASECESNRCVDGYCCDQPCDGQCEACDVRNALGTCLPVTGAPHGDRAACAGTDPRCAGRCDGEHTVRCSYATNRDDCGSSCSDGKQTDGFCNGQGDCEMGDPYFCDGLACADDFRCNPSCEGIGDCLAGHTCQQGRCEQSSTCLDEHTSLDTDGSEHPCVPYRCAAGSCKTSCDDSEDCTDGTACDPNNRCVPLPPRSSAATNGAGCGCRVTGSRSSEVPWLWVFLVAGALPLARRIAGWKARADVLCSSSVRSRRMLQRSMSGAGDAGLAPSSSRTRRASLALLIDHGTLPVQTDKTKCVGETLT